MAESLIPLAEIAGNSRVLRKHVIRPIRTSEGS